MCGSENESRKQVHRIIAAGVATHTIIVNCSPVEKCIAGVLGGELQPAEGSRQ
jgi:hypothetical protein